MKMPYAFQHNDGGRSLSKRSRQKNDCTVRALAIACDIRYDDAYDILASYGRKCAQGFHFFLLNDETINGYTLTWKPFSAVKDQRRMNPVQFAEQYPCGRYICRVAKHVYAVIDGVVCDTFLSYDERCIYGIWELTMTSALEKAERAHEIYGLNSEFVGMANTWDYAVQLQKDSLPEDLKYAWASMINGHPVFYNEMLTDELRAKYSNLQFYCEDDV